MHSFDNELFPSIEIGFRLSEVNEISQTSTFIYFQRIVTYGFGGLVLEISCESLVEPDDVPPLTGNDVS